MNTTYNRGPLFVLLDADVGHGGCLTVALVAADPGLPLVGGQPLRVHLEVRLHGLPHLLLRVKHLVGLTWQGGTGNG